MNMEHDEGKEKERADAEGTAAFVVSAGHGNPRERTAV